VIDTQIWQRTGFEPIDLRGVVRLNIYKEAALNQSYPNPLATPPNISSSVIDSDQSVGGGSVAGSFKAYKGKIFLLVSSSCSICIKCLSNPPQRGHFPATPIPITSLPFLSFFCGCLDGFFVD
jgi:hypothetical protein